eukprot:11187982-Lingulodinium_polyedra.AAC.1
MPRAEATAAWRGCMARGPCRSRHWCAPPKLRDPKAPGATSAGRTTAKRYPQRWPGCPDGDCRAGRD